MAVLCNLYNFVVRALLVAALLKSSLEIILITRNTSRLIVSRSKHFITFFSQYAFVDSDICLRYIMKHQVELAVIYGWLILAFCVLVLFNFKTFIKPLVLLILGSIVFFEVDLDATASLNPFSVINEARQTNIITMLTIVSGLLIIDGRNTVKVPKVKEEAPKKQAPA